ncbi:GGDEF domain-containing protein [Halanaerobium saccharolyticum]|uniref:GGDEF domain-containing protein n=1 Tax=Halanaerobium saccharolyticum TaxID=43595 RepID=UPI003FCDFFB5
MQRNYELNDNLENKIFKIILLFGIIISLLNIVINYLIGFSLIINLKWIVMAGISFFSLMFIRKAVFKVYYLKLGYYLFLIFIFLPFSWFQSGGSNNNSLSYIFLILISITFLFKRFQLRNNLIFSLVAVFMLMFSLEYFYPELLISHSEESQFYDKLVQTPIVLLASYLLLLQFANAYNQEKSKLGLSTKKLRLANKKLKNLANRDPLTKKYNRRAFDQEIRNIFKEQQHLDKAITLILFDIDNFKEINDNYGHDIGDQVLIKLTAELEKTLPDNSLISRWGGDEFAVICYKNEVEAQKNLDTYYQNVEKLSQRMDISITVSAGLSRLKKGDQIQALFKRVDDILYKSKEDGKARYTVA